jgi:hypothetical protein
MKVLRRFVGSRLQARICQDKKKLLLGLSWAYVLSFNPQAPSEIMEFLSAPNDPHVPSRIDIMASTLVLICSVGARGYPPRRNSEKKNVSQNQFLKWVPGRPPPPAGPGGGAGGPRGPEGSEYYERIIATFELPKCTAYGTHMFPWSKCGSRCPVNFGVTGDTFLVGCI